MPYTQEKEREGEGRREGGREGRRERGKGKFREIRKGNCWRLIHWTSVRDRKIKEGKQTKQRLQWGLGPGGAD